MNKEIQFIVVSYCPLLYASPGTTDPEIAIKAMRSIGDDLIKTCVWVMDPETKVASPILVMDRAHEYAAHALDWSEIAPGEWFTIKIGRYKDIYYVSLYPNLEKTLERFKQVHYIQHMEKVPDNPNIIFIYKPLIFLSKVKTTYDLLLRDKLMPQQTKLGFLDTQNFDMKDVEKTARNTMWLGPLKVDVDDEKFQSHLMSKFG